VSGRVYYAAVVAAGLLFLLMLVLASRWIRPAFEIATGYSAKQICSGVFVAGLPAHFVIEKDIHLSMGMLGPLLSQLKFELGDGKERQVRASLLGSEAVATYTGRKGCTLSLPASNEAETWIGENYPADAMDHSRIYSPNAILAGIFDEAFAEPAEGQRRTLAVVVLHRGEILAERYAEPVDQHTPLQGWSMNKSLMATWIGLQVRRGKIALMDSVAESIAVVDPTLAATVDPVLNLGHLLHMESGFDFEETYFPGDDATRMLYRSPSMWRVAPANGHAHTPGDHFSYSSGDTNLAAWLWTRSLGAVDYQQWLLDNFAAPLGIRLVSEADASGVQVGSSYTYMSARDWAKVGQLWLDAWHGRTHLLPREWMRASVTARAANIHGNYGRGLWLNTQQYDFPGLPRDMFYASGHNGQYVAVFPRQELVVVRLGLSSGQETTGVGQLLASLLEVFKGTDSSW
jgi:CubicO group peptidase (beta-lactamase class C family)